MVDLLTCVQAGCGGVCGVLCGRTRPEGEEKLDKTNQNQKETGAMVEYLLDRSQFQNGSCTRGICSKRRRTIHCALVGSKAITAKEIQLSTVSLEAETLGQYY
jgi:hypothetical protein